MNSFFVGPFLAAFALALGATHWEIGFISAIALPTMPMLLVGCHAVDRWKQRRAIAGSTKIHHQTSAMFKVLQATLSVDEINGYNQAVD